MANESPKIRIYKNLKGVVVGISINDTIVGNVTNVNIDSGAIDTPEVKVTIKTADLDFVTLNTTATVLKFAIEDDAKRAKGEIV